MWFTKLWFQNDGVNYWLSSGADAEKINFGLATYARTFTLLNPNNSSLYANITGGGTAGPYTRIEGVLGYNEVIDLWFIFSVDAIFF